MSQVHEILLKIELLAEELKTQNDRLQERNQELQRTLEHERGQIRQRDEEIVALKSELGARKTALALAAEGEGAKEAKAKINALMREIDRCIALLNE